MLFLWVGAAGGVWAGEIATGESEPTVWIAGYSPMGQSFTAEDSRISSIGFLLSDLNPQAGDTTLTYELFEGIGFDGLSLGRDSVDLAPGKTQWSNADFSLVNLTVGQNYSVELEGSRGSLERWGVHVFMMNDPYPGGTALVQGQVASDFPPANFITDLCFRVEPIPEPRPVLLILCGLLLPVLRLIKRNAN